MRKDDLVHYLPTTAERTLLNHAIGLCRMVYDGKSHNRIMKQFDRMMLAYEDYDAEKQRLKERSA